MPELPKVKSFLFLCNILRKKCVMKLVFLADKHQSFLQVDFNTLDIKVPYKVMLSLLICMIKQSIQNNKFAISLQYLKKKLGMEFIRVKHQSFCKLVLLFLMEVVRHVQSTQKRNLVIFLQFFKKKVSLLLLCSFVMQNIQIFYGAPVMFVLTCYSSNLTSQN